ncbi:MAG: sugar isomerase [Candidatus Sumerlaeota bacterium]|nr:sugar isomerase [Candidatus Sumerlaeota bacterium]
MSCCSSINRRTLLGLTAGGIAAGLMGASLQAAPAEGSTPHASEDWDPERPQIIGGKKLVVQPLLRHEIESYKPQRSWRNWGDIHTEEAVTAERKRIGDELARLSAKADFPIEILPLAAARNDAEAAHVRDTSPADAMILYAAGANRLDPCISGKRHNIIFVRHRSGATYDWYENASNRFLRVPGKDFEYDQYRNFEGVGVDDIVVDDYDEILWRLRAIYGVKNFVGSRAVTIGKASGKGCARAPELCRDKYKMEIVEVPYSELERRIRAKREDAQSVANAEKWAARFLAQPHVVLKTQKQFVINAFFLYIIFKDLMRENQAQSFTIQNCMSAVMPIAQTTACLALTLLQDEGHIAFCESDFASHPAGVLLRYVTGKPVFMHNPTFPHKGLVTCAHCASPCRFDGRRYEGLEILTHYESDYGASPKVAIPPGTAVTLIDPDCAQVRWMGFKGIIEANPSYSSVRALLRRFANFARSETQLFRFGKRERFFVFR